MQFAYNLFSLVNFSRFVTHVHFTITTYSHQNRINGLQFRKPLTLHSVRNGMGTIETSFVFLDIFEYEKQTSENVD